MTDPSSPPGRAAVSFPACGEAKDVKLAQRGPRRNPRSGFGGERPSGVTSELSRLRGSEGCETCAMGPPPKPSGAVSVGKGRAVERVSFRLQAEAKDVKLARTCLPNVYHKIAAIPCAPRGSGLPDSPWLPGVYQTYLSPFKWPDSFRIGPFLSPFQACQRCYTGLTGTI